MSRMPRHTVPLITQAVIHRYYQKLPSPSQSAYYVLEAGPSRIPWCALRVQRTQIQIGLRKGNSWFPIGVALRHISLGDVKTMRQECLRKAREFQDEDAEPSLKEGHHLTWTQGWELWRAEYVRRKQDKKSPRTLDWYDDIFKRHVLPLYGHLSLRGFSLLPQEAIEDLPNMIAQRVRETRPWAEGVHTGNHVFKCMRMLWQWFHRKGWINRDPFVDVEEIETSPAEVFLEDEDLAAIGRALRELEAQARAASATSRQAPSLAALLAIRIVLYTGCRHVEELLRGKLAWFRTDYGIPRLEVPRVKGQRKGKAGRFIYLGPDAVRCLMEIPRAEGVDDLVPGRSGRQMSRLTEPWERVILEARRLLEAKRAQGNPVGPSSILRARIIGYEGERRVTLYPGDIRVPVKATRHTCKTAHPRIKISDEHGDQLLGHSAASLGDRVYLHRHGTSLSEAAEQVEAFIRHLMGDLEPSTVLHFRGSSLPSSHAALH